MCLAAFCFPYLATSTKGFGHVRQCAYRGSAVRRVGTFNGAPEAAVMPLDPTMRALRAPLTSTRSSASSTSRGEVTSVV